MAKQSSPSFVLTLELEKSPRLFSRISDELEICRVMYNSVLGHYLKREKQMKRTKTYKRLIREYKGVSKKLNHDEENPMLIQDKMRIQQQLKALRETFQLTEYASHEWARAIRKHFGDKVNAAFAQKTASRAWLAFQKKLFGKAKKVHFIRKGDMDSFEGKANTTGWRYIDRHIVYQEFYTPVKINIAG